MDRTGRAGVCWFKWLKGGGGQCTRPFSNIPKDKVKASHADAVPSGCAVIVFQRMKMSYRRTAGPKGTTRRGERRSRGSLRRAFMKDL